MSMRMSFAWPEERTREQTIGFGQSEINHLFKVMGAIILIGQLIAHQNADGVLPRSFEEKLAEIAFILELDQEHFVKSMLVTNTGEESLNGSCREKLVTEQVLHS